MWERTLQDLVRGLRANKKEESRFISRAIDEIREEIKKKDMDLKAAAVLKLVYVCEPSCTSTPGSFISDEQLEMLGYDMRWAAFYVVEVMSSPKSHIKSVGYLAATQSFHQDTDVLTLTTNLLRKVCTVRPLFL
jgi:AP-3 complex subunit delta-1